MRGKPLQLVDSEFALSHQSDSESSESEAAEKEWRAPRTERKRRLCEFGDALPVCELDLRARDWVLEGEYKTHSKRTLVLRTWVCGRLQWFCDERELKQIGARELKAFFGYLNHGHEEGNGRWNKANGQPGAEKHARELSPATVRDTYYAHLRAFFAWMVQESVLEESPFERLQPPKCNEDQIEPFSDAQVKAILNAAKTSRSPLRDEAIVLLLLDTGMRSSELCNLKSSSLDVRERRVHIENGKGRKKRTVYFQRRTARALWHYMERERVSGSLYVFLADRNQYAGQPLLRDGLGQLIRRLCKSAGVHSRKSGPHMLRHTFAVNFLRAGGNSFTLKNLLGHTSLKTTNRYVNLSQADGANQHRQFSPVEHLFRLQDE